jgi:type II secretory pathway pseudopilin PulG
MPERKDPPATPLGIYDRTTRQRITGIEVIALALSAVWLLGAVVFFAVLDTDGAATEPGGVLRFMMIMLAIFLPVAMIWVAATAARASKVMREESQRLQAAIDAIRQAYVAQNQARNTMSEPSVAQKLEEIAAAQRKAETALAMFSSTRHAELAHAAAQPVPAPQATDDQVALPLGTTADEIQPPLDKSDFIRALHFPETTDDREGFAALRKALKDRKTAQLIQAAQDVLTLMSHDGIYMDDLTPDMARPELWRRFASGERGRAVAALGGVRDRSSLALTAARMKQDPIFRDAAHHFLRLYDRMFTQFAQTASDAEISQMSDTRTARAFMLLGRVAGTFD